MRQRSTKTGLMAAAVLFGQVAATAAERPDWRRLIVCDGPDAEAARTAIVGAVRLLPRLPSRVAVIDANDARPEVRTTLLRLDAFVTKGSPVVYVVAQSRLLAGARANSSLHVHALAAVIWHEMAHADGANERQARQREEALWTSFIRDERLDTVAALRYLRALTSRPDDEVMAAR
jgi:hypothetical protein